MRNTKSTRVAYLLIAFMSVAVFPGLAAAQPEHMIDTLLYIEAVSPNGSSGVLPDGRVWGRDEDGTITVLEDGSTTTTYLPDESIVVWTTRTGGATKTTYWPNGETTTQRYGKGPAPRIAGPATADLSAQNSKLLMSVRNCLQAKNETAEAADQAYYLILRFEKEKLATIQQKYQHTQNVHKLVCR